MLKSRKIIALALSMMMVLSAISGVAFAAPETSGTLPNGYLVVNSEWEPLEKGDAFNYILGGESYSLAYGYTAFATIEDALAAFLPAGMERVIVLAPGLYSSEMTFSSDIHLVGPYFNKSPNNKPGTDCYDSSLEDWALANDRSIDPTKEAVLTSTLSIATGCDNIILDGIAFTGNGQISDAARDNVAVEVNYILKNLYFAKSSVAAPLAFKTDSNVNRFITIDSCRMENSSTITEPAQYSAEVFEVKNSYFGDLNPGGDKSVQFYLYGSPISSVINPSMMIRNTFEGNHFENIYGCYILNCGAYETATPTISQRLRVRYEVINNEFINTSTGRASEDGRVIHNQYSGGQHELIVKGNTFIMDPEAKTRPSVTAIGTRSVDGGIHTYVDISNNYIQGFNIPIGGYTHKDFSQVTVYNVYDNKAYTAEGVEMNPLANAYVVGGKLPVETTDLIKYGEAEVLTYRNSNRVYIDLTESDEEIYTFPTKDEITAGGNVTCTVYSDDAMKGTPITKIALKEKINRAYLLVEDEEGNKETYNIYIFSEPHPNASVAEKSSQCALLSFKVADATVVKTKDGYTVTAKDGAESIAPEIKVSNKATYNFYLDAECKYPADNTDAVKLNARFSKFYVRVTAEDGTLSDVIPITVMADRKPVAYADKASIPEYARTAVNYLNENGYGIFSGDEQNKMNPCNNITRYELAKVMVALSGVNVEMTKDVNLVNVFDDFYKMQWEAPWAIPYVRAAYVTGLIAGELDAKGNLYFNGSAKTTREQFTTIFVRNVALSQNETLDEMYSAVSSKATAAFDGKYADQGKISTWALNAVKLATYYGFVNGDGKNFNPKANIIRADVAVVIYNSVK